MNRARAAKQPPDVAVGGIVRWRGASRWHNMRSGQKKRRARKDVSRRVASAASMTTSPRALALPPVPTSPVILSPDAIKAMTTKNVAQVAVARAGIQSELCLGALIGRIHGRTFEGDWSRENLSRELAHLP